MTKKGLPSSSTSKSWAVTRKGWWKAAMVRASAVKISRSWTSPSRSAISSAGSSRLMATTLSITGTSAL